MSANPQTAPDPLAAVIAAFQQMVVPPQPIDPRVLAQLPAEPQLRPARQAVPSPRKRHRYLVAASLAAAVVLALGARLFLWNEASPRPTGNGSVTIRPLPQSNTPTVGSAPAVAERAPPRDESRAAAAVSPARQVANAQVIVVAKALDAQPAQLRGPGDLQEYLIRYQVVRVLKGDLHDEIIFARTPTAPDGFLGKEWILLLPPDYMAGKHLYAAIWNIKSEPEIASMIENRPK
jgi:hypothetical protein